MTPVATNMISNVCMIYHMKVRTVSYNFGQKNVKIQNWYFAYIYGQTDLKGGKSEFYPY